MKKLILYLGLLCVMFSVPQVANAADVSNAKFCSSALWGSSWTEKAMTKSDKGFYWNGTVTATSGNYSIKRGWNDGGNDEVKFVGFSATSASPYVTTTGSTALGNISNLELNRPYIFSYWRENNTDRFGIVNKIELFGNWNNDGTWVTGATLTWNSSEKVFKGSFTPAKSGIEYGVKLCAGSTQIGWLFPSATVNAGGCNAMTLNGSSNGTSNLTAGVEYSVSVNPANMTMTITPLNVKPSALYQVYYTGGAWHHDHTALTKSGNKFTGEIPAIAGTDGRVTFFTQDGNSFSSRGLRYIPTNKTTVQDANFTDNMKVSTGSDDMYWRLGTGKWSYEIDFSGDTPVISFTKDPDYVAGPENLYFRFNTAANAAPGHSSWIYSNPTQKNGNIFKGSISVVNPNGAALCFATRAGAGWAGTYNYGPAENTTVDPDAPDTAYPMALGNTASWHLTKGIWSFECDFSDAKNPTVKFNRLYDDASAENHDQLHKDGFCDAPRVYIAGPATPGEWGLDASSQMVHVTGSLYTYTVPAASGSWNGWKAGAQFKIAAGISYDNTNWNDSYTFGNVQNIAANAGWIKLGDAHGTDGVAATTFRDVPADAVVEFDTDTQSIRITYTAGQEVDAADSWTIGGAEGAPEIYVVGEYLNDNKPNPGYRMTYTGGDTYTLDRFVVQENTEFSLREYLGASTFYKVGPTSAVTTDAQWGHNVTTKEFATSRGEDSKTVKWTAGVAMISLTYHRNANRLEVTIHPEVPNQAEFDCDNQVYGVPYVAFVGGRLSQHPGNTTTYNNGVNNTKNGWQDGWQAYSANHKREIMGSTVSGVGNAGEAIPNTIWPPRHRIDFQNVDTEGNERNWTTDAITFNVNPDCVNKELSKEDAIKLLEEGQGVTIDNTLTQARDMIPTKAIYTRYDTDNILMNGWYKLWSGWGGHIDNGSADWYHHHNWGVGDLDKESSINIQPNLVYYSRDELNPKKDANGNIEYYENSSEAKRDAGGNFDFTDKDKYFKQFSFYSARYYDEKEKRIRYRYFFVARLAAEDPRIAATRGDGPTDLEAEYSIQQQITGAEVESKMIKTCKVYISEPDGTTFNTDNAEKCLADKSWADGISIKDFNAQAAADRTVKALGLPAGDYRFKVVVTYDGDVKEYDATSNVLTVFPQVASHLELAQVMTNDKKYTFGLRATGTAPAQLTDEQKANITSYKLTVNSQTGRPFPTGAKLVVKYTDKAEETFDISGKTSPQTITVTTGADYSYDMPEVIMQNARVGKTYRFTIQSQGEGLNDPGYTARARVFGPHATMALTAGVANSAGVECESDLYDLNGPSLRAASNWMRLTGTITDPDADAASLARYNVSYELRHIHAAGDTVHVITVPREKVIANGGKVTIDYLPVKINADGSAADTKHEFAITTIYDEKDVPESDSNRTWTFTAVEPEKAAATLPASTFIAPRTGGEDDQIVLVRNYAERFHGLHSYWYDAYLGLSLSNTPFNNDFPGVEGVLVGALAEITTNGSNVVAPVEAGGNYAYGNLLEQSNLPEGAWWHSPLPEGTTGHEHYNGKPNNDPFYAFNGQNQWFCTVDHSKEAAAKGAGTISDREADNLMADAKGKQSEDAWLKGHKIYRKVHHVHHEARYFASAGAYVDHSEWAFDPDDYTPVEAKIYYAYNMLATDHATVTSPVLDTPAAKTAMRAASLPANAEFKTVLAGKTEKIGFSGITPVDGATTGIDNVTDDNDNAPVEYYNLQGVKVENPAAGVYIFRQGSRTGKILIK